MARYNQKCHRLLHHLIGEMSIATKPKLELPNKFSYFIKNQRLSSLEDIKNSLSLTDENLDQFAAVYQLWFRDDCRGETGFRMPSSGHISYAEVGETGRLAKDMTVGEYLKHSYNSELVDIGRILYPPSGWPLDMAVATVQMLSANWHNSRMVVGGYEKIIDALIQKLSSLSNVKLCRNNQVQTIMELENGFRVKSAVGDLNHQSYIGAKIIYACSEVGLGAITHPEKRQHKIRELINNVTVLKCFKLYLTYERAWWEDYGYYSGVIITDLPLHEFIALGDNGKSESSATLLAAYTFLQTDYLQTMDLCTDERFVNKAGHIASELIPSKRLVDYVHTSLKLVLGKSFSEDSYSSITDCNSVTMKKTCRAKAHQHFQE